MHKGILTAFNISAVEIADKIGVTKRTAERTLKKLQDHHKIVRSGSKKTGHWIVIK